MEHEGFGGREGRPTGSIDSGTDRLASLLSALAELKSNISKVEAKHPALGEELSSLCDLIIDHLNRPDEDITSSSTCSVNTGPEQDPCTPPPTIAMLTLSMEAELLPDPPAPGPHTNPIASAFDIAGGHIVNGLDKMGDGIIFAFERLLRLPSQKKWGADEDKRI